MEGTIDYLESLHSGVDDTDMSAICRSEQD